MRGGISAWRVKSDFYESVSLEFIVAETTCDAWICMKRDNNLPSGPPLAVPSFNHTPGGGGILRKIGWGVRPASQNPYPIYDQNLRYSQPYLWLDFWIKTLFLTSDIDPFNKFNIYSFPLLTSYSAFVILLKAYSFNDVNSGKLYILDLLKGSIISSLVQTNVKLPWT